MAFTAKSKRRGYDNIANGSATGIERVIAGGGPGDSTTKQRHDNIMGTSTDAINTSLIANRVVELHLGQGVSTSDSNWTGMPSSTLTPAVYYTSVTSYTSAVGELNTAI